MIRIIVADDHPVVREGLKRLVGEYRDMEVVAEASCGEEALAVAREVEADLILLDVSMPGPGVLEVIRQLREERSQLRILVLSIHPEEQYAVRTLRAGAVGYLMKNHTPEELAGAIRQVHRGGRFVSASLAERLALGLDPSSEAPLHERLSGREFEVLCLMGSGLTMKEIAARLERSPKTVSTYRARLLEKLRLRTTADLIRYAVQNNLKI